MLNLDQGQNNISYKESLKGKVTVLEFWIKSCGYCMLAFEDMRKLKDQYSDKNVNK